MAESLFSSLRATLEQPVIGQIAGALGLPEQTASRGLVASIATLFSGLATKADNPGALRSTLESAPAGEVSWRQVAGSVSDPGSPLMGTGKRLLANIFGSTEGTVVSAISRELGIGPGAVSTMLASVAPMVIGFINNRVREGHLNMTDLGEMLKRESGAIRAALPASLRDMFWPAPETRVPPLTAHAAAAPERRSSWLPALLLGLIGLGLIWFLGFHHMRRTGPGTTGTASRVGAPVGGYVPVLLPNGVQLNLPQGGTEIALLKFIQDPNAQVNNTTWFTFDRTLFDKGSASLQPGADQQIKNEAAILSAYPKVRVEIAGFTDNTGTPAANMQLARARAKTVYDGLIAQGIAPDRLSTQAYGQQNPAAANETQSGRAMNRRVAVRVTQK